ncbi:MAG: radical SAM protein, partial [Candidatus Obscuribacterales bacterium]|nr:radical SAM protein [Candidatus Obscuribacterales bacterium]
MKQSTIDDIRLSPLGSAYVHVPFCSHKCDFCDFATFAGLDHMEDKYFEVLGKEIEQRIREVRSPISLNTIYFGGGTPAMVSAENIDSVLTTIKNLVEVEADLEVTLESTPQAISKDKVLAWRASGINRLSIGVGSLNDSELTAIGRDHTVDEALTGIEIACQGGFDCISLDLIYDLPTQNLSSWESTLSRAVELLAKYESIKHMSAYGLHLVGN